MSLNSFKLYKSIGRAIKKNRRLKKLGQEDLAKEISLSRSSLSNIEIGKHQASIYTIYEIALALDCSLSDLLPPIEDLDKSVAIDEKYLEIYNSLPEDSSKKTLNVLKEILKKDD